MVGGGGGVGPPGGVGGVGFADEDAFLDALEEGS